MGDLRKTTNATAQQAADTAAPAAEAAARAAAGRAAGAGEKVKEAAENVTGTAEEAAGAAARAASAAQQAAADAAAGAQQQAAGKTTDGGAGQSGQGEGAQAGQQAGGGGAAGAGAGWSQRLGAAPGIMERLRTAAEVARREVRRCKRVVVEAAVHSKGSSPGIRSGCSTVPIVLQAAVACRFQWELAGLWPMGRGCLLHGDMQHAAIVERAMLSRRSTPEQRYGHIRRTCQGKTCIKRSGAGELHHECYSCVGCSF